ncbi:unnamed protein product, partial [Ectocarpus fasciculatus]
MGCAQSCQQSNCGPSGGRGGGGAVQTEGDFGRDGHGGVGHEAGNKRSSGSSGSSHHRQQTGAVQKPTTSSGAAYDSLDRRRVLGQGEAGPPGAS